LVTLSPGRPLLKMRWMCVRLALGKERESVSGTRLNKSRRIEPVTLQVVW
jgi:hypothetical protein